MIDVVPGGVVLTDPIVPYAVKPVDMQLTLNSPGNMLLLTGSIRVRTTNLPASSIENVVLTWKEWRKQLRFVGDVLYGQHAAGRRDRVR
jgi:hypothetical protein